MLFKSKGDSRTHLIRLARKEHGAIPDPKGPLLLLALSVDLRYCPRLNGISLRFIGSGSDAIRWVDIGADGTCWLWWLSRLGCYTLSKHVTRMLLTESGTTIDDSVVAGTADAAVDPSSSV